MFDAKKRRSRFREIFDSIKQKAQLSIDYDNLGEDLFLEFQNLLGELRNYDLEMETCVELIDVVMSAYFYRKNDEKSTVLRIQQMYDGYSGFMLKSYMRLCIGPNDNLLQDLVKFDLYHGVTVNQLVTNGWFYFHNWPLIQGLEHVIFKSKNVYNIMLKVALKYFYCF